MLVFIWLTKYYRAAARHLGPPGGGYRLIYRSLWGIIVPFYSQPPSPPDLRLLHLVTTQGF